jgi:hypothetical protein
MLTDYSDTGRRKCTLTVSGSTSAPSLDVNRLDQRRLFRGGTGPHPFPGQADRRTMGYRPWRLPSRRPSAGMGGMERQISRHAARLLEERGRHDTGFRSPRPGLRRRLRPSRPQTLGKRELHHRP